MSDYSGLRICSPTYDELATQLAAAEERAAAAERDAAIWKEFERRASAELTRSAESYVRVVSTLKGDLAAATERVQELERDTTELRAKLAATPVEEWRRYLRYSQVPDRHHRYDAAEQQADEAAITAWLAQQDEVHHG